MTDFKNASATLFHELVQLERSRFFGEKDVDLWMPKFQTDDARTMCPPFMGKNYKPGGLIIIPINPGGGNGTSEQRNYGDSFLYPIIHEFKSLEFEVGRFYWETFVPNFKKAKMSYSIYNKMLDILEASETTLDDICYFNFLPYRVIGNRYPASKSDMSEIIPRCRENFVEPLLTHLRPSIVVTFGKQVDVYIREYWDDFEFNVVSWNRARAPTRSVMKEREISLERLRRWAEETQF